MVANEKKTAATGRIPIILKITFAITRGFFSKTKYSKESCALCGETKEGQPALILQNARMCLRLKSCTPCFWKIVDAEKKVF